MSEKVYDGQSGLMSAEIKITAPNICFQFPIEKFLLTKDVYINKPYQFSIIQNCKFGIEVMFEKCRQKILQYDWEIFKS